MSFIQILSLCFLMFSVVNSWAAEEGTHTRIHHQYVSTRAIGMGDVFIAPSNDYSALFYNPAGLARREQGQINLSLQAGASPVFVDFYKDLDALQKQSFANDAEEFVAYSNFLNQYYGKPMLVRATAAEAIWARPGWALGFVPLDLTIEYEVHNQAAPALNLRAFADSTLAYGIGRDIKGLLPGRFSWGATAKFIHRGYANTQVNSLDLVADSTTLETKDLREGYTVDADLGFLYTPVIATEGIFSVFQLAKPTFGFVARNLADYGFGQSFGVFSKEKREAPEKLYRVFDVGAKFEYPSVWIFSGRGEINVRDMAHPNFTMRRALHIGFEFDWTVSSWWKGHYRVGLNQGYISGGASAMLGIFNLDFATYSEEVGTYDNPKENRIYIVKTSMDL